MITRFAPSPTGEDIHIGNLRIAVLNYYHAKQTDGKFIVRIEDTANDRLVKGCDERILTCMHLMGMTYDDLVYQSANKQKHLDTADYMVKKGLAFVKDGAVWVAGNESSFTDGIYGLKKGSFDDFVIVRSNGEPSFIFANILDDLELIDKYGELTVIRGNDHIDNTLKQVYICSLLGKDAPSYYSVSMVHGTDGKPLSKRDQAGSVSSLLKMGISPEALYEYLLHLGNGDDLKKMLKSPVIVDLKKILSLNKKYMTEEFVLERAPYVRRYYKYIKDHIRCIDDLEMFSYLWKRPPLYEPFKYCGVFVDFSTFNRETAQKIIDNYVKVYDGKFAKEDGTLMDKKYIYTKLRKCLCGVEHSLDLALVMEAIGIEECLARGLEFYNKEM